MVDRTFDQDEFENASKSVKEEQSFGLTLEGKMARRVILDDVIDPDFIRVKRTPKITNYSITDTDEHTHTFQANVKAFSIRCRTAARMNISFEENMTSTEYYTNGLGGIYREDNIKTTTGFSIYFRLDRANRIVEILEWT